MKTHELIDLLASDPMPVQRHAAARRFGLALPLGLLMSLGLLLVGFGLRPDLAEASIQPMFWAKAVFALAMFCGALWVTLRLSRPAQTVGRNQLFGTRDLRALKHALNARRAP